jgi:hypothetical protein
MNETTNFPACAGRFAVFVISVAKFRAHVIAL